MTDKIILNTIKDAPEQMNELGQDNNNINNNTENNVTTNPVNGRDLYNKIKGTYNRYMALQEGQAETLAWWTMFSHTIDAFNIAPKLLITSPEKRCGKSTLLDILNGMVKAPLMASNITPAAMFRAIDKMRGTVMIDEADTFIRSNPEINGVINSGHRKSSAYVIRTTGENHDPKQFSTWAPMAIAMIGQPADTIEDRSVRIELKRKTGNDSVERFIFSKVEGQLEQLKEKIAQWALENFDALRESDPEMPEGLNDRAMDNWMPLVSIADTIDENCGRRAREVALLLSSVEEEATPETRLLSDIQNIFLETMHDKIATTDILENLYEVDDGLWAEWNRGNPLKASQLASKLKPFGIKPKKIRIGLRTIQGYELSHFQDAFDRYLDCSGTNKNVPTSVPASVNPKPLENKDCSSVPLNTGGQGAEPCTVASFFDNGENEDVIEPHDNRIENPHGLKRLKKEIFGDSQETAHKQTYPKSDPSIFDND